VIRVKITNPDAYWKTIEKQLNKTVEEGIKDVGRLAAIKCASSTFPSGTSGKVKTSLQNAIFKDVNRAYIVNEHSTETDDGSYLQSHRNSKGRVSVGLQKKPLKRADYEKIKQRLVKTAGLVKAVWLQAASQLSAKVRVPAWLRKGEDLADVVVTKRSVTITNKVKYASNLITDKQIENAIKNAYKGLFKLALRKK
jgi:hypothetical protein